MKNTVMRIKKILAWMLSLALVISIVNLPVMQVKAASVELELTMNGSIPAGPTDGKLEIIFNAPTNYRTMKALADAGYTTLEITVNVAGYTQDSNGTAGAQPFVNYGDNWKSKWTNLESSGTKIFELDLSAISTTDTSEISKFGIQFANVSALSCTSASAKLKGVKFDAETEDYSMSYTQQNQYDAYTEFKFTVKNESSSNVDGNLILTFDQNLEKNWVTEDFNISISGKTVTVSNLSINANSSTKAIQMQLKPMGAKLTGVTYKGKAISATATTLTETGSGGGSGGGSGSPSRVEDKTTDKGYADIEYNYAKLLQESLYFYDANMCGPEVEKYTAVNWRKACHSYDQTSVTYNGKTIDVSGGFHDAGDHDKFGLPQGYSATILGIGYYEFKEAYEKTGQTEHIKNILDYFCDYFVRCTVADGTDTAVAFCYQVGDGASHNSWASAESENINRPGYFADANNSATDQVSEAAAALAMNYINFGNEEYLACAKKLFNLAKNTGKATNSNTFYASSSWADDYCLAAALLYKATKDSSYLAEYDKYIGQVDCGGWPSWDQVGPYAVAYATDDFSKLGGNASSFAGTGLTADGYTWLSEWGSNRYNANVQLEGLVYDNNTNNNYYSDWASGQLKYMMGNNNNKQNFIVGYNKYSTKHPHHRSASGYAGFPNQGNQYKEQKYCLLGALAGGMKNIGCEYDDNSDDYYCNEVAIDYNAAFVGACAAVYLLHAGEEGQEIITADTADDLAKSVIKTYYGSTSPVPADKAVITADSKVTIDAVTYGYTGTPSKDVKISNTGNAKATEITAKLESGTAFALSAETIADIAEDANDSVTVSLKNGLDKGIYTDILTIAYNDGTANKTKQVNISATVDAKKLTKADITFPILKSGTIYVGDILTEDLLDMTAASTKLGTFTWAKSGEKITASGDYEVNFTLTDTNYAVDAVMSKSITISAINAGTLVSDVSRLEFGTVKFDGELQAGKVIISNEGDDTVTGVTAKLDAGAAFTVNSVENVSVGKGELLELTVTPKTDIAPAAYEDTLRITAAGMSITIPVSMIIEKADNVAVGTPVLSSVNSNSITIAPADQEVAQEYAIVEAGSNAKKVWQETAVFNNLKEYTRYEVYARAKETANFAAGAVSEALVVTTNIADSYTIDVSRITSVDCDYVKALVNPQGESTVSVYSESDSILVVLLDSEPYTITGSNESIVVESDTATSISLDNATIKKLEVHAESGREITVSLIGTNNIKEGIKVGAADKLNSLVIEETSGSSKLNITQGEIVSTGSLKVESGAVAINSNTAGISAGKDVTVAGGSVDITSGQDGINAENITVSGGSVGIISDATGITADSVTVSGGSVGITSDTTGITADKVTISAGTTDISSVQSAVTANKISVTGGDIKAESTGSNVDSVINAEVEISLTGGTVSSKAPNDSDAVSFGVGSEGAIYLDGAKVDEDSSFSNPPIDLNAHVHEYKGHVDEVSATCTEKGVAEYYTCTDCDKKFSDSKLLNVVSDEDLVLDAKGHKAGEPVKENELKPSCEKAGSYDEVVYCTVCKKQVNRKTNKIHAKGHKAGAAVKRNVVAATCSKNGSYDMISYCTECKAQVSKKAYSINKIGHKWDGGRITKKATPVMTGIKSYTCTVCKATKTQLVAKTKAPKKGTKLKYKGCKYRITKSGVNNGTVVFLRQKLTKRSLRIPDTIKVDGVTYKVTAVAASALKGNKKITKLVLGKNIKSIGKYAFYGCKKLKAVTIRTSLLKSKRIGKNAFKGLAKKATVKVPSKKLKTYKKLLVKRGLTKRNKIK